MFLCQFRMDARLLSFSRDLSHRHGFLTHLCMLYLRFFNVFSCVWTGCLIECTLQLCACVCLHGERAMHKVVIPVLFLTLDNNRAYRAPRQTSRFHLLCCGDSLYNFLSGERKGMAVSTITAVKAGLLPFFPGPETARYAR